MLNVLNISIHSNLETLSKSHTIDLTNNNNRNVDNYNKLCNSNLLCATRIINPIQCQYITSSQLKSYSVVNTGASDNMFNNKAYFDTIQPATHFDESTAYTAMSNSKRPPSLDIY